MSHLTRVGNPSVFASLPFDQIEGFAGYFIHDEFIFAQTVSDYTRSGAAQASDYAWWGTEIDTNDATANGLRLVSLADHQGILQIQSGTDTPAAGDGVAILLGPQTEAVQDMVLLDDNGIYLAAVISLADWSDQDFLFGLEGQLPEPFNAGQLDAVVIGSEPTDFTGDVVVGQVNTANTDVETAMASTGVDGDWILVEVGADNSSAAFRYTTEDVTETVTVNPANMPSVALRPVISTSVSVNTTEVLLDIDTFHMRYLRRDSLVGQGADWLGQ